MLPKKITLENFGPFVHETVDFTELHEQPLFLISGKTGAGKTTIFDAITYALFGEASGGVRGTDEFRSSFAAPSELTRVQFIFEHQGKEYQIERLPKQLIAKKNGTGMTEKAGKVQLTIYDQGKEVYAYAKKNDVAKVISELLHLNREQFSQIVMLPQGEFRNFLIATSEEKEKLLRNLFGTESYLRFTEYLKDQKKGLDDQAGKVTTQMTQYLEQLPSEQGATLAESITLAKDWLANEKVQLKELQAQVTAKKQAQAKLQVKVTQAQQLIAKFSEQTNVKDELATFNQQQPEIEKKQQVLAKNQRLASFKASVESSARLETSIASQVLEQTQLTQTLLVTKQERKTWQREMEQLEAQLPEIEEQRQQLQQLELQVPLIEKREALLKERADLLQAGQTQRDQISRLTEQIVQAKKELTLLQLEAATKPVWQERDYKERGFLQQLGQLQADEQALENEKERESDQQIDLAVLLDQISTTSNRLTHQQNDYQQIKSQWAALEIARLSKDLVSGTACPVCGSIEHPNPAAHAKISVEELNQLQLKLEELEVETQALAVQKAAFEKQYEQQLQTFNQQQDLRYQGQKKFSTAVLAFVAQLAAYYEQSEQIPDLERLAHFLAQKQQATNEKLTELTQVVTEAQQLEQTVQQLTKQQAQLEQTLQLADAKLAQLKGQLETLMEQTGEQELSVAIDKKTELQAVLTSYDMAYKTQQTTGQVLQTKAAEQTASLVQVEKQLAQNQAQLQIQQAELTSQLAQQDVSLAEVIAYLADPKDLEQAASEIQRFQKEQAILTDRLQRLDAELEGKTIPELQEVAEELETLKVAAETAQNELVKQQTKQLDYEQLLTKVQSLAQKNQQQISDLAQLTQLFDTFNGNNPQKISLERYVLQWYLTEVLQSANQQLAQLTNGRYKFELNQKSGSYKKNSGLEINIFDDNAGKARSAHSLSGGESFIAALSLALGLADVIQAQAGGVAIDTLFIDEGFGSLDEEALDVAITALEKVENDGRMIGIISHVKELKERIVQQILVETSGTGQSTIDYRLEGWSGNR